MCQREEVLPNFCLQSTMEIMTHGTFKIRFQTKISLFSINYGMIIKNIMHVVMNSNIFLQQRF
jgi:hypothetical protein